MPRKLPWATPSAKQSFSSVHGSSTKSRDRSGTPSDLVDSDLDPISTPFSKPRPISTPRSNIRTPSSSPPPSGPPTVEFMRSGPQLDDRWIMVEDEFVSTAKLFTMHIHHAEYMRLKRLARSRGDDALKKLERGTDGVTAQTPNLKRKFEARENEDLQLRSGVLVEYEEEEKDEYLENPMLAGLMMSSKKKGNDLRGLVSKAKTRAAAGYTQSPNKGERTRDVLKEEKEEMERKGKPHREDEAEDDAEDTDDDDLDAKPSKPRRSTNTFGARVGETSKERVKFSDRLVGASEEKLVSRPSPKAKRSTSILTETTAPRDPSPTPAIAKSSPSRGGKGSRVAAMIAQRKAKREEERERERVGESGSAMNEIPTFIV